MSAEDYFKSAVSHHNSGNYAEAIKDYTKAIEINPKYALAYSSRAISYQTQNNLKAATRDARKACELGDCEQLKMMAKYGNLRD